LYLPRKKERRLSNGGDTMYHEFNKRLEKAKKGDSKAVEQILNDLHPLIISSIKRYYYRLDLFDDLIQDVE
jgi:RNA polymerase sporulation-specific sigma factor